MQVVESEIVIPLKYKSRLRNVLIQACVSLVFFIGLFTFSTISLSQMNARMSQFSDAQNMAHTLMVFWIVTLVLMLLIYGLLSAYLIRKLRGPSPFLRINHEGIFTSIDAFLFRWEEIKEFTPYTFLGYPILRIVPWNAETVASRAKASSRRSRRFAIDLNQRLVRRAKSPAPFGIAQKSLPMSIDELTTTIQEHFAAELREYHITVRGWQQ